MERLRNNSLLIPDMIAFSSFNIYKRTTKKYISNVHVSWRHNINDDSNNTDNNINFKTNYHIFFTSTNSQFFKETLYCLSLIQKKNKNNQTIHQTHKVVPITSLQVGVERGTKLSVQRGAAWRPSPFPFSGAVFSPVKYLTVAVYQQKKKKV